MEGMEGRNDVQGTHRSQNSAAVFNFFHLVVLPLWKKLKTVRTDAALCVPCTQHPTSFLPYTPTPFLQWLLQLTWHIMMRRLSV